MSELGGEEGVSGAPGWRPATAPDFRSDVEAARKGESQIYIESLSSRFWGLIAAWGLLGFAAFLLWVNADYEGVDAMSGVEISQMALSLGVVSTVAMRLLVVPQAILANARLHVRNPWRTYDFCVRDAQVMSPILGSYGRLRIHDRVIVLACVEHYMGGEAEGQERELRYAVEDAHRSHWPCEPAELAVRWTKPLVLELLLWLGWVALGCAAWWAYRP
ncbi:MAG: hypothetical protein ABR616_00230 [Dermatophilaceae bacterium]|nr:hypothetical protein [Intrasporangiaceae bacterium]